MRNYLFWSGYMEVRIRREQRGYLRSLTIRLGGDALGSASDILYTPDGLVRQAKLNGQPVIYVGINYRLGSTWYCIGS